MSSPYDDVNQQRKALDAELDWAIGTHEGVLPEAPPPPQDKLCDFCLTLQPRPCTSVDQAAGCVGTRGASFSDAVVRPNHYTRFAIEPITFIMENNLPFWLGNIIKYVMRWDAKDGIQDLKKARRYLDMRIKQLEGDPHWAE